MGLFVCDKLGRDMSEKTKTCLQCGNQMEEGMLPDWWNCRACNFFLDMQDYTDGQIIQYSYHRTRTGTWKIHGTVPNGCLFVASSKKL